MADQGTILLLKTLSYLAPTTFASFDTRLLHSTKMFALETEPTDFRNIVDTETKANWKK